MSRIDLLINRSTEARTASPVHFEFHYKGLADFEVVLMEKNLLKIKLTACRSQILTLKS